MPGPKAARQKLARRACDSCKVRKIRCTEVAPCNGCVASGVECTFNRIQAQRGPRGLRAETIKRINLKQRREQLPKPHADALPVASDTSQLLSITDIYASRLFPIWPIIDTIKLKRDLVVNPDHASSRRLANAVALATIAQLKLETSWQPDPEKVKRRGSNKASDLLDDLRISFFLHIYHENAAAGRTESLLFLREAITQVQIMRLEHESTYASLPDAIDQQICRRVLWLLFVTERGVALLHKLPPILKPNILFPWYGTADESSQILPAFLKLVHLFWIFDQSEIFEMLQDTESDMSNMGSLARTCLELLQQKLHDSITDDDWGSGNDVQRADMFLTRQWMRAILWRAAFRFGIVSPAVNPVSIAREFLSLVSQIPAAALESHGATLEFKTFEIATAILDAVAGNYPGISMDRTADTLHSLQKMLSSSRGGNNKLLSLLNAKMRSVVGLSIPRQPCEVDRQPESGLLSIDAQVSRHCEDILTQVPSMTVPPGASLQDAESQVPWPTLDLSSLVRSPSPLTRILLGDADDAQEVMENDARSAGKQ